MSVCAPESPIVNLAEEADPYARTYRFNELPDRAKESARDWLRTSGWEWLTEDISEMFESTLQEIGFEVPDGGVQWSLSHCQGDGVAFEGPIDIATFLAIYSESPDGFWKPVSDSDFIALRDLLRRFHEPNAFEMIPRVRAKRYGPGLPHSYADVEIDDIDEERVTARERVRYIAALAARTQIEDALNAVVRTLCTWLTRMGYDEIDYHESDEQLQETCDANDYRFWIDGDVA